MYDKWLTYIAPYFNWLVAAGGAIASYFFGGWHQALSLLLLLAASDFVTGIWASTVEGIKNPEDSTKGLNSRKGFKGIFKKFLMFLVIAILYRVDVVLGLTGMLSLSAGSIYFYVANEAISLAENMGRIGVPMPSGFKKAITMLKEKSENKGE